MNTLRHEQPTKLFKLYVAQLVARLALFVAAIVLYVVAPEQLNISEHFGLAYGFDFIDLVFVMLVLDFVSKFRPHAKIAMGSKKQYGQFHVPTPRLFAGGPRELLEHARSLFEQRRTALGKTVSDTRKAVEETTHGVLEAGMQFSADIDLLRLLPWTEEDLTATEALRHDIRRKRLREIVSVLVFWIVFNVAIGLTLDRFELLNERTVLLWVLFYFVFDLTSVVLWCPLQLLLMRNRCCTTCQIFNWDAIMAVTPLFCVGGWFGWLLILWASVVLVHWELAFVRHPERFDERTNASLRCANCVDKLCYLRKPLTPRKIQA